MSKTLIINFLFAFNGKKQVLQVWNTMMVNNNKMNFWVNYDFKSGYASDLFTLIYWADGMVTISGEDISVRLGLPPPPLDSLH